MRPSARLPPGKYPDAWPRKKRRGGSNDDLWKEPDKRLAGGGRRTNEETGFGPMRGGARLSLRRGCAQRHQHDNGRSHCDRSRRVHDHAEWALVRIRLIGVEMGNLDKGQQHQQCHAHQRNRHTKPGAGAAVAAAKMCPKSNQDTSPHLSSIHTPSWTPRLGQRFQGRVIGAANHRRFDFV